MMQRSPIMIVKRVVIQRGQLSVYDEHFHTGVNIIRGDNSSGKSTILNFIFYGLGGDLSDWSDVALKCDHVILEVSFNGILATLKREISQVAGRSMEIFGGPYELSLRAPVSEWYRYPYRRSESMESFSQAIFRLLDLPEVTGDETGNLTIHQVLRLLYADQLSPVEQIFRFEPFDPPQLRESVGRLLCGAYDGEVYNNEFRLKDLNREFDHIQGELKSLFSVLGRADQAHTLEWIEGERRVIQEDQARIQADIEVIEKQLFLSGAQDEITLRAQEQAYEDVQKLQSRLAELRAKRDKVALTIADSDLFIENLNQKLRALSDSEIVVKSLGDIRFRTCPACYAPIEQKEADHSCHLCRTPFDAGPAQNRIAALINETGRQLKQSQLLQRRRIEDQDKLVEELHEAQDAWMQASKRLSSLQRLPSGDLRAKLRQLNRDAGYLERRAEDIENKTGLANEISNLILKKDELNYQISRLKTRNEHLRAGQAAKLTNAYALIERQIVYFLRGDLERQDAFVTAKHVEFSFSGNSMTVDGQSYFSASSRVVLRSSFFIGFLLAATIDKSFRHPRFCMIDTIEDKGMEQARSHNFQRMIVQRSRDAKVEHQIIFATAMIAPELDVPELTVGKASTLKSPTIDILKSANSDVLF
ncbi:AAA family ATPase [Methylobacterium indicum]|uniref:AAA family ATPase n=1 Tax=Methylobacterium indicum TaxID=1775910 RepID=UPI0009EC476D|nr:AAA family ATPase [Methylobacterium indicum]